VYTRIRKKHTEILKILIIMSIFVFLNLVYEYIFILCKTLFFVCEVTGIHVYYYLNF